MLLLVSALSVGLNRGLKLSEFNYQIKVQVSGEDTNKAIEVLRGLDNIARVNKRTSEVYFYKLNKDEVQNRISESFIQNSIKSTYNVFEYRSDLSQLELAKEVGLSLAFFVLISTIFVYITLYRLNSRLKIRNILIMIFQAISYTILTLAMTIGTLALVSNLYQIKKDDILVIYIVAFLTTTIYSIGFLKLSKQEILDLNASEAKIFNQSANFGINLLKVSSLIILALSFGLGVNFIMTGVLILLGIIYSLSSLIIVFKFDFKELKNFNFGRTKKKKTEVKKETKKTIKKSPQKPSTARSKKAKTTKKRKI